MNIKKIIILCVLVLGICLVALFFLYSNNLFANKTIVNKVTTSLNNRENVSLQSKVAELVSNKTQIDEIALELCSVSVYNFAYSKERILYQSDLSVQKRVIDCAKQYNVDDYESLMREEIKPGKDIIERLKTMACIYSVDYLNKTFSENKNEYTDLLNSCLDIASKNIQVNPPYEEGKASTAKERLFNCERIASKISPFLTEINFCHQDNGGHSGYDSVSNNYLCLDTNKMEKFSQIALSNDLLIFLNTRRNEFELFTKNNYMKECLLDYGYFGNSFVRWSQQNFNDSGNIDY